MTAKRGRSRRSIAAIAVALTATLGLALEGARFLHLDADLQEARSALREAVTIVERVGPAATAEDVVTIADDISQADASLGRARGTLDNDPLLTILRVIPPVAAQIDGASRMAAAAQRLTSEHREVARLMERYVEIRDGSTGRDRMARLIKFAADEQETIGSVLVAIQDAATEMSGLSEVDLIGPLAGARTERFAIPRSIRANGREHATTVTSDAVTVWRRNSKTLPGARTRQRRVTPRRRPDRRLRNGDD